MPKLFCILGYYVFFWSNEKGEPVHVHVAKGGACVSATKILLTSTGSCMVAHNKSILKTLVKK